MIKLFKQTFAGYLISRLFDLDMDRLVKKDPSKFKTMKGGFYCPHCKTCNACSCETCKPFIKEGEYVNQWTEDGEAMICGKCNQVYTPDQALEEEYQQRKTDKPYEQQ